MVFFSYQRHRLACITEIPSTQCYPQMLGKPLTQKPFKMQLM